MMIRRSTWSLISARKAGSLIAPADLPVLPRRGNPRRPGEGLRPGDGGRRVVEFRLRQRDRRGLRRIGGRPRLPVRLDALGEHLHLLVGQRAAVLREGRASACPAGPRITS